MKVIFLSYNSYLKFIEEICFTNQMDGPRIQFRDEGSDYVGNILGIREMFYRQLQS